MSVGILLLSVLTPLHPGAGRSPGVVDLPIIRDSMNYPFIPGSELKGALKTLLGRKSNTISNGKIDCKRKPELCCILGGEAGEEGASAVQITGAILTLLPAPSPERGVAYITTPYLLARAADQLDVAGKQSEALRLRSAAESIPDGYAMVSWQPQGPGERVMVGTARLKARKDEKARGAGEALQGLASGLNSLFSVHAISDSLVVVDDSVGQALVDSLLIRMTRVRISRDSKTVEKGALWTEEYIPPGSLFTSLILDTGFRNSYCHNVHNAVSQLKGLINQGNLVHQGFFYLVVGGKESVGGGLVKAKIP